MTTKATYLGEDRWRFRFLTAPGVTAEDLALVPRAHPAPAARVELLAPPRDGAGAPWAVVVALAAGPGETPPDYDVTLDGTPAIVVSFRADEAPARPAPAAADHTARDFADVATRMLRDVAEATGNDGNVAAETTALVEALAYVADGLSYQQDALATEAYLSTARRRVSVTRHAALLGYEVGQGANARTWVRVETAGAAFDLPARTPLLTRVDGLPPVVPPDVVDAAVEAGALVFETVAAVRVLPGTALALDPVVHPGGRLPAGATRAAVAGHHESLVAGAPLLVEAAGPPRAGHVVTVVEAGRVRAGDRDVTEVVWDEPLPAGEAFRRPLRFAAGGLVEADHGRTWPWFALPPPDDGPRPYRPALPLAPVTFAGGLAAVEVVEELPAGDHAWQVRRTLLESGPLATDVVVEVEDGGQAWLRFGDGEYGLRPRPGATFRVRQRTGGGPDGNVPAHALGHVVTTDPRVARATNPVPARGGTEPETVASVRVHAPYAFRTDDRAVTVADHVAVARRVPGVLDVVAYPGATGAGPVLTVHVHTGWPADDRVLAAVREALAERRLAGVAVEVVPAVAVPVEAAVLLTLAPGAAAGAVRAAAGRALRERLPARGRFGFGTPFHHGDVLLAFDGIDGVADVAVTAPAEVRPRRGQVVRPDVRYDVRVAP
jgi:hypothetical protein